jgi:hypothetical protein
MTDRRDREQSPQYPEQGYGQQYPQDRHGEFGRQRRGGCSAQAAPEDSSGLTWTNEN